MNKNHHENKTNIVYNLTVFKRVCIYNHRLKYDTIISQLKLKF